MNDQQRKADLLRGIADAESKSQSIRADSLRRELKAMGSEPSVSAASIYTRREEDRQAAMRSQPTSNAQVDNPAAEAVYEARRRQAADVWGRQ